jgi:hypothetical protein
MLSVDPVTAYGTGDLRFLNRYAYAFNNPYRFTDPDGRCPVCPFFFLYLTIGPAHAPGRGELTQSMPAGEQAVSAVPGGGPIVRGVRVAAANAGNVNHNRQEGARRQEEMTRQLRGENPNASVQNEQYLRNADGSIARASDGTGRRVDHAVIENGRARTVETTSLTADKRNQISKERDIIDNGGTYVRDRSTKQVVPVEGASEIRRVPE